MKLLPKTKTASAVMIICDLLVLAAAVVLDALRGSVPADFSFDPEQVEVVISHPYELFGIVTAVLLVVTAVMTGFIIADALTGARTKTAMRFVTAAVLLTVSAAAILFSHFFVCGAPVENRICFVFEDSSAGMNIAVQETEYSFGSGTMEIYKLEETVHDHEDGTSHAHYEVSYITGTEIHEFSTDASRYTLDWVLDTQLRIRFYDGDVHRTLQFSVE